jgi:hypothetical protein
LAREGNSADALYYLSKVIFDVVNKKLQNDVSIYFKAKLKSSFALFFAL